MTKIVEFPKNKIVREAPLNQELIEQAQHRQLQNHADGIVDELIDNIVEHLDDQGIEVDADQFLKDMSLPVDGIRAAVYRTFGLKHDLHQFIDENVKMINRRTGEVLMGEDVGDIVDIGDIEISELISKDEDTIDTSKL